MLSVTGRPHGSGMIRAAAALAFPINLLPSENPPGCQSVFRKIDQQFSRCRNMEFFHFEPSRIGLFLSYRAQACQLQLYSFPYRFSPVPSN